MTRRAFSVIGGFFEIIGSAVAVASAIENRRTPSSRDLRNLGIDPAQFREMGRR